MEIEDGVIWVYGVGEDGVLAFTDFGIESLLDLIKIHTDDQHYLGAGIRSDCPPCGLRRMLTSFRLGTGYTGKKNEIEPGSANPPPDSSVISGRYRAWPVSRRWI